MNAAQQKAAAKEFVKNWTGRGYEKGETHIFWTSLLRNVFGIEQPEQMLIFEQQVKLKNTSFIDVIIPSTHVMIEQKGSSHDLSKPIPQSDGSTLTPYQQAKRYALELPYSQRPRWIVACNFKEFRIYDMENPQAPAEIIQLEDLPTEYYRLEFLVDETNNHVKKEMELSLQAGEIVGKLYDSLLKEYKDPSNPETLKSLNMLCVRLVFCLYAEDAGIFGKRNMFHDYLSHFHDAGILRRALIDLFQILNTPTQDRDPYLEDILLAFPYVNGGLFEDTHIEIPTFNDETVNILLNHASNDFDWSGISPTIFGAVFESTLNPETRRKGGMHYTSIENIHKVIDPLFLDELDEEFNSILEYKQIKAKEANLKQFQKELASLTFLDPACGSGNFLTETYISLRRLENKIIAELNKGKGQVLGELVNPIEVSIQQFYGIEINDFAATVAKTALWIAESQMMKETEELLHIELDFLPLKSYVNIREDNALRIDWQEVVPKEKLNYIMGNPPFVGTTFQSKEQKKDIRSIFGEKTKLGNLDFVSCWFYKGAQFIKGTTIKCAFVSTNSITQGEQVATLWKPILQLGISIFFAHRTFRWDNESKDSAAVHCIIVGFYDSYQLKITNKKIYSLNSYIVGTNINPYLIFADDIIVSSNNTPINGLTKMIRGNQPTDGGNLLLSENEYKAFITQYPNYSSFIKVFVGADEFINNKKRYCFWITKDTVNQAIKNLIIKQRIEKVKETRLNSRDKGCHRLAETPYAFREQRNPDTAIVIPSVSSENRRYIPIDYVNSDVILNNRVNMIPNGPLHVFAILNSNVHMAWMRTVTGRLEMRYNYSIRIVYNNFPVPSIDDNTKIKLTKTAQGILDARKLYSGWSLAELYNELSMPPELRKAHQENDCAVMEAYGFSLKMTEAECVAKLMEMYQELTKKS